MQAAALKVCNVAFPAMETWLFRCCSCSSLVHHWDATLSKKTAVATVVLCTPDLISLVSTFLCIQLLGAMQLCIYSEFSQWGVTGAMVGTAVHIRRRGGGFGTVANYHSGAVCQCVLLFPTSYKNIMRGLRMVVRLIETLFTTLVIWCRPGSSGDTSTNQPNNTPNDQLVLRMGREGREIGSSDSQVDPCWELNCAQFHIPMERAVGSELEQQPGALDIRIWRQMSL